MEEINGKWTLHGIDWNDPTCLHNIGELTDLIEEIGFMPFFECSIEGFSVEERTDPDYWWAGEPAFDPWEWRAQIAREGKIVYGRFFNKKTGSISKKWFPYFANLRRDGYDFESLWDDEKASVRQKKIMDLFDDRTRLFSYEIKDKAGFGKGGLKNFDGTITSLQMHTYLCMSDFQKRRNKKGAEYGWDVAVYSTPEHIYGYKHVTKAYGESCGESYERIAKQLRKHFKDADEKAVKRLIKGV